MSTDSKNVPPEDATSNTTTSLKSGSQFATAVDALPNDEGNLFRKRFDIVRKGYDCKQTGHLAEQVQFLNQYLGSLCRVLKINETELRPEYFNPDNQYESRELLLISQVYWELALIYDKVPNFASRLEETLKKFSLFSVNQHYQQLNSEMMRRAIRNSKFQNKATYNQTYQQIYVKSKHCFIATCCFGESHPVTDKLRELKSVITQHPMGLYFVKFYYYSSSRLVSFLRNHPALEKVFVFIARPILLLVTFFVSILI